MEPQWAVFAVLLAGYGLIAARLDRLSVGPALAFVAIGIVLSNDGYGPFSYQPAAELIKILAEATLALLLFADASTIPARTLERDIAPTARLLIVGLPLTVALGTVAAILLFPGMELGVAMLIAATLAPTDAALGQPVLTNSAVPARIRRLLTVESGLNDGIATPFVFLALALSATEATGSTGGLVTAITDIAIGVGVGLVAGFAGGVLLRLADRSHWASAVSRQLFVLALAGSCYLVAASAGGNGFIAAFVGGLAFGAGSRGRETSAERFTETQGSFLAIGVWVAFGLTLSGRLLSELWDPAAIAYAVLSLTIIRIVPVAIALTGLRFARPTILFVGWFGPRGLASIVFLIIGLEGLEQAGVDPGPFGVTVAWTVLLSVVAHGLTAAPLAARYGRRIATLPESAPELEHAIEAQPGRTSWAGDARTGPAP